MSTSYYTLPVATQGYEAGTVLRDMSLREARAIECNRCGDCCNGLSEHIKHDETTGLPLSTWGSKFPLDLYESRYGKRMLQPIGFLDNSNEMPYQGRIGIVDKFEEDENNKPYTCFTCSFHRQDTPETSTCMLMESNPNPDPTIPAQVRPLNCGDYPVFGTSIDDTLVAGHNYVPATGALPRCAWYGVRIVGPYKDELFWRKRWMRQQNGLKVPDLNIPLDFIKGLVYKSRLRRGLSNDETRTKH